jgi:hypothetical protein
MHLLRAKLIAFVSFAYFLTRIRAQFGDTVQIIAGNVASYMAAKYLLEGATRACV